MATKKADPDKDLRQVEPTTRNTKARCTATTKHGPNAGKRCKQAAINGGTVCVKHGGSAPQVRAKATQRLMAMVMPALAELDKILRKKGTSDTDRLRAIREVLSRTGFSEAQIVALTPVDDPWAPIMAAMLEGGEDPAIEAARKRLARMSGDGASEPLELPASVGGGGFEDDIDQLNNIAMRNANRDTDDRNSYLSDDGHDVVRGEVIEPKGKRRTRQTTNITGDPRLDSDGESFHSPVRDRLQDRDEQSEFDPAPTRKRTDNKSARTKRQRYLQEMGEQDD